MINRLRNNVGFLISAIGAISAVAIVVIFIYLRPFCEENVIEFYQFNLRGALFGGLLTVSAFLFSLKTFIVVKMKESVYDAEFYGAMVKERQKLNPNITRYGPLRNLSKLLFWAVLISLLASFVQFSVGLIPKIWAVQVALAASLWSIGMILLSLLHMQSNLRTWFDLLEDHADSPTSGD